MDDATFEVRMAARVKLLPFKTEPAVWDAAVEEVKEINRFHENGLITLSECLAMIDAVWTRIFND